MPLMNYEKQMKNAGHMFRIEAMHIKDINGKPDYVEFFPYIEGYTENYDSSWNEEDVFARMDGIANFVSVKRSFTLSLRVAAGSEEQARENQFRISKMIRFLYPAITPGPGDGSFYFRGAPILRLKLGNVISDTATNGGLFGYVQGGFSITPSHKDGWFAPQKEIIIRNNSNIFASPLNEQRQDSPDKGQSEKAVTLFFKYFDINFTFKVLHNHPLGTNAESNNQGSFTYFPYGVNNQDFSNGSELNPADLTTRHEWDDSSMSADDRHQRFLDNDSRTPIEDEIGDDGYTEYGRQIKAQNERYIQQYEENQRIINQKKLDQLFGRSK